MKVLLTGATGLVGKEVGKLLVKGGHQVVAVTRRKDRAHLELPFPCEVIEGDLGKEGLADPVLSSIEAVIHLMGESVGEGRWTPEKKKKIYDSRVLSIRKLKESLVTAHAPLRVFLSSSAVGIYADRGEQELTEDVPPGTDFLAKVCIDWEAEVGAVKKVLPQARTLSLRTGIVLSEKGGALEKMQLPFQWGLGGKLGSGQQWMSWIHLQDLAMMFVWALQNEKAQGVVNAVAPEPVRNLDFSKALAQCFGKSLGPAVPAFALKLALGEFSQALLSSQRVQAKRVLEWGFQFQYPQLEEALRSCTALIRNGSQLLYAEQYLPASPREVWPFFADAKNLERITPDLLNFKIEKMSTEKIQKGTLIDYKLKIRGLPVHWQTEITNWEENKQFEDVQLKGPYEKWEHRHEFHALGEGTLMIDVVRYQLPLGILGNLAAGWMVKRDVREIFAYRRKVCARQKFGST